MLPQQLSDDGNFAKYEDGGPDHAALSAIQLSVDWGYFERSTMESQLSPARKGRPISADDSLFETPSVSLFEAAVLSEEVDDLHDLSASKSLTPIHGSICFTYFPNANPSH